jgi:hypothetical protein
MSTALAVGAAVAVLCLGYVLYPLVRAGRRSAGAQTALHGSARVTDDEIEAAVRAYRAAHVVGTTCATCGVRPESDAVFCSNCGRRLVDSGH